MFDYHVLDYYTSGWCCKMLQIIFPHILAGFLQVIGFALFSLFVVYYTSITPFTWIRQEPWIQIVNLDTL